MMGVRTLVEYTTKNGQADLGGFLRMDEGGVFAADQNLSNARSGRQHSISRYREFIRSFRNSFDNTFIYRDQLRRNVGCVADLLHTLDRCAGW